MARAGRGAGRVEIRAALGEQVLALEHVGSTSVPGLAAKPVLDLVLTVADPADEAAYVPALEPLGLLLHIREPEWEQHRMLTRADRSVNLHVFGPDGTEPARVVAFRDWLRAHDQTARRTARSRPSLAEHGFERVMDYNNHKAALVYDLHERIFAADPAHPHDPQPRPVSTHPLWRPFELVDLADAAAVRVGNPKPRHGLGRRVRRRRGRPATRRWPRPCGTRSATGCSRSTTSARPRCPGWRPSRCSTSTSRWPTAPTRRRTSRRWRPPASGCGCASRRSRSTGCSPTRTLTVNLHVWSPGTPEPQRHLLFRDFLRAHPDDAAAYGAFKAELARGTFSSGMDYNNQKAAVVYDLYEKAFAADPAHDHDPAAAGLGLEAERDRVRRPFGCSVRPPGRRS